MARVGLYLRSNARVPEADGPILSSGQQVLRSALCIRGNVHDAFVGFQSLVQSSCERLWASRGCHCGKRKYTRDTTLVLIKVEAPNSAVMA